jgi:hypothetical protein
MATYAATRLADDTSPEEARLYALEAAGSWKRCGG